MRAGVRVERRAAAALRARGRRHGCALCCFRASCSLVNVLYTKFTLCLLFAALLVDHYLPITLSA